MNPGAPCHYSAANSIALRTSMRAAMERLLLVKNGVVGCVP